MSEICQFCPSKIGKISKIIKNPKNIRFAVESEKLYIETIGLVVFFSIKIFRGRVCYFFNF